MDTSLKKTDDEKFEVFMALDSPRAVAGLLEVPYHRLTYLLYKRPPKSQYTLFELPKKAGGKRLITAPVSSIKILQAKLNSVLQVLYERHYPRRPSVTGFRRGQSVVSNAERHVRKRFVLNIDLEDFFPSINFGRVRGMFMAKPYELPANVATVLAALCCYDRKLPQGAPTSPMVSNMICARLDSELGRLAKNCRCTYSRYADDITFSTRHARFPTKLGRQKSTPDGVRVDLGNALKRIIRRNGFMINDDKVSLRTPGDRQEVTGLVVNAKVNVPRKFVRQIRAMLHAWDKFGEEAAESEYRAKYCHKRRRPGSSPPTLSAVVRGKLGYLAMVRGHEDLLFRKLRGQYEELAGFPRPMLYSKNPEVLAKAVWVIEGCIRIPKEGEAEALDVDELPDGIDSKKLAYPQGTAFMTEDFGLVTNDHVALAGSRAFKAIDKGTRLRVSARYRSGEKCCVGVPDLAVLAFDRPPSQLPCLPIGDETRVQHGDTVYVVGYPGYDFGDLTPTVTEATVASFRNKSGIRWIHIDKTVFPGNSGGPVLNERLEVIGVATKGSARPDEGVEMNGVLPISALRHVVTAET